MPKRKYGMNHAGCLIIAFLLASITESSGQPPPHARVDSYRALRLSYTDLSLLLLDVQEILQDAATDSSKVQVDWMTVSSSAQAASDASISPVVRESEELTLNRDYVYTAFAEAPPEARSVFYEFRATKHPITKVLIKLEHSRREVKVAGTSRFQVVRLADAIHKRLKTKEQRFICHVFLIYGHAFLYFLLFAVPAIFVVYVRRVDVNPLLLLTVLGLYAVFCRYVMESSFWWGWFPATGIGHGKPGFFF